MIQKIVIDGTTYSLGAQPAEKTPEMTTPVGMDTDGKLYADAQRVLNLEKDVSEIQDKVSEYDAAIEDTGNTKKRVENLEKVLQGYEYGYQTDDSVAYKRTVPAGVAPWATLDSIGGRTAIKNQLINTTYAKTQTINGVTFTNNSDGTWTVSGTATEAASKVVLNFTREAGKYYLLRGCPAGGGENTYRLGIDYGSGGIINSVSTSGYNISIKVEAGVTVDNLVFTPQLIDLTKWFCAGNEPTTVEEAYARGVPEAYIPYTDGEFIHGAVTKVKITYEPNHETVYEIPAEIQALPDYGKSNGHGVYNEVDFENRQYIRRVAERDVEGGEPEDESIIADGMIILALSEPEVIDISGYLEEIPFLPAEPTGQIILENNNKLDVPGKITYIVRLLEA